MTIYHNNINKFIIFVFVILIITRSHGHKDEKEGYKTAIGDPGMQKDGLRVAIESWNQCNEVGKETPLYGSPRAADCFDFLEIQGNKSYKIQHKVTKDDNKLGFGTPIPGLNINSNALINNVDLYAPQKEIYLAKKCQVKDKPNPWHFWMIMLKNGNLDTLAAVCPNNGVKGAGFSNDTRFDCFGKGCMRHPTMHHHYTKLDHNTSTLSGRFFGTWDTNNNIDHNDNDNGYYLSKLEENLVGKRNDSYYSVTWKKEIGKGSWVFHHVLQTSLRFPWLMLYLRADAIKGFSGGYHYDTRGMIKTTNLESPNFKVTFSLNITKAKGAQTQFYLMDMGSCWKNNGKPCDGDVTSDVTRYSEMILNPEVESWCKPSQLDLCPPYHTFPNGITVSRNDTDRFPYDAYHMYCAPGNAQYLESPSRTCDGYSNPQAQEIVQILPHPVWKEYGYPTIKGQGWIGDPKTWLLDVGRMSHNLYFYQDPGTTPIKKKWSSIDLGVEVYRDPHQVVEWTVSDFDIIIPLKES